MTNPPMLPPNTLLQDVQALAHEARLAGNMPRVHPNGFIQLDLEPTEGWDKHAGHSGANRRLHIWNPPGIVLPHQDTVNEVHDHIFDMESTVIVGALEQRLYEFVIGGSTAWPSLSRHGALGKSVPLDHTHELFRAIYDQRSSSRLESVGVTGHLRCVLSTPVRAVQSYTQPAFTLHDTETPEGLCVTIMTKRAVHEGGPTVICPLGQSPDNDFDRLTAAPQELLWDAINRSLAR